MPNMCLLDNIELPSPIFNIYFIEFDIITKHDVLRV